MLFNEYILRWQSKIAPLADEVYITFLNGSYCWKITNLLALRMQSFVQRNTILLNSKP